jgi:prepilin peptidase dependent protein B
MLNVRARNRGITLMELLIGTGIALLLLTGLIMAFTSSTKTSSDTLKRVRQSADLRGAMGLIVKDLRRAGYWGNATSGSGAGSGWSNPFGAIDTATPGCISFRYDRDGDGALGAAENFGFRLNAGAVESMTAGDAANCAAGGNTWEAMTDPKASVVTVLTFQLYEEAVAVSGGGQVVVRTVEIALTGQPVNDASGTQQLAETVRIRNDLFRP